MDLATIRTNYPMYGHLTDEQLLGAIHDKYYNQIPLEEFHQKVGYTPQQSLANEDSSMVLNPYGTDGNQNIGGKPALPSYGVDEKSLIALNYIDNPSRKIQAASQLLNLPANQFKMDGKDLLVQDNGQWKTLGNSSGDSFGNYLSNIPGKAVAELAAHPVSTIAGIPLAVLSDGTSLPAQMALQGALSGVDEASRKVVGKYLMNPIFGTALPDEKMNGGDYKDILGSATVGSLLGGPLNYLLSGTAGTNKLLKGFDANDLTKKALVDTANENGVALTIPQITGDASQLAKQTALQVTPEGSKILTPALNQQRNDLTDAITGSLLPKISEDTGVTAKTGVATGKQMATDAGEAKSDLIKASKAKLDRLYQAARDAGGTDAYDVLPILDRIQEMLNGNEVPDVLHRIVQAQNEFKPGILFDSKGNPIPKSDWTHIEQAMKNIGEMIPESNGVVPLSRDDARTRGLLGEIYGMTKKVLGSASDEAATAMEAAAKARQEKIDFANSLLGSMIGKETDQELGQLPGSLMTKNVRPEMVDEVSRQLSSPQSVGAQIAHDAFADGSRTGNVPQAFISRLLGTENRQSKMGSLLGPDRMDALTNFADLVGASNLGRYSNSATALNQAVREQELKNWLLKPTETFTNWRANSTSADAAKQMVPGSITWDELKALIPHDSTLWERIGRNYIAQLPQITEGR